MQNGTEVTISGSILFTFWTKVGPICSFKSRNEEHELFNGFTATIGLTFIVLIPFGGPEVGAHVHVPQLAFSPQK